MPLTHRWTGRAEADLLARLRLQCYGLSQAELPKFHASVMDDSRCPDGEFLVVEDSGRPVGTAASLAMTMFHRGAAFPTHGVAYVGTVRTDRRKASTGTKEPGIATVVMNQTVQRGRDRGDVVTALIPFRASYYEHFGYGQAERQATWRIPTALLPAGDTGRFLPYEASMLAGLKALRRRIAEGGSCDFDRPDTQWATVLKRAEAGFFYVDVQGGEPRGWAHFNVELEAGVQVARVLDWGAATHAEFLRLLHQMGSWKDQYARVYISVPVDMPLNRFLRESQLPHRPVAHAHASVELSTRTQIRVLDHRRFLEALRLPVGAAGETVVSIAETEGHESRLLVRSEGGRLAVSASRATPTFTTTDRVWSSIASGDLAASHAVRHGLASGNGAGLDVLSVGPKPYTHEFF